MKWGFPETDSDRAAKAFQRIWQHGWLSKRDLDLIVEQAREYGAWRHLRKLGSRYADALKAIENLSSSESYRARATSVLCLSVNTPEGTRRLVLQRLLHDHEPQIREAAFYAARFFRFYDLIDSQV